MRIWCCVYALCLLALTACGAREATVNALDVSTPILASNAGRVRALQILGRGELTQVAVSPTALAVTSTAGTWLFDLSQPDADTRLLRGHQGTVTSAAFSGSRLATGGDDRAVWLWNVETGAAIGSGTLHEERITAVAFSPDGTLLASASEDRSVRLWRVLENGLEPVGEALMHNDRVTSVAFAPLRDSEGNWLLAASRVDRTITLWQVSSDSAREITDLVRHAGLVSDVAFAPTGDEGGALLASSGEDFSAQDNTVHLWNARLPENGGTWEDGDFEETAVLTGHNDFVHSVAFAPQRADDGGYRLASTSSDQTVRVWHVSADGTGGELERTLIGHAGLIWNAAFQQDGTLITGGGDGTVRMWDVTSGLQLDGVRGFSGAVISVAFSPDGALLATGSQDNTVRLWDVASGRELAALRGHRGPILTVAFSPDGSRLASGSRDQTIWLWNVRKALEQVDLVAGDQDAILGGEDAQGRPVGHNSDVRSVAFSADGAILASGGCGRLNRQVCEVGEVRLWDLETLTEIAILSEQTAARASTSGTTQADYWVESVAFTADGSVLATGSRDYSVRLWDVETGLLISTLRGHKNWVEAVTFSPDGALVASASVDDTARVWNVQNGAELDDLQIANGNVDRSLSCYRLAEETDPDDIEAMSAQLNEAGIGCENMTDVLFNPAGSLLVTSSNDNTVRLWDVRTGTQLALLSGHAADVTSLAFRPDGAVLASGSTDGTVRLWGIP